MQSFESCCNNTFLFEAQLNLPENGTNNKCLSVSHALNYSKSAYADDRVRIIFIHFSVPCCARQCCSEA